MPKASSQNTLIKAIANVNLIEIEEISNKLIALDLDDAQTFQELKPFLLLIAARHLFLNRGYLEAEMVVSELLKVNLTNEKLYKLLNVPTLGGNLGGNFDGILQHFKPETSFDHTVIAIVHSALGNFNKAIDHFQNALRLSPLDSNLYIFLGNQFVYLGYVENAKLCFEKSINVCSKNHYAWFLLACLSNTSLKDSAKYCKQALAIQPNFSRAKARDAFNYFYLGKMKLGWEGYENRLNIYENFHTICRLFNPTKKWTGQSLDNKTIIVFCEQGFGDAIQFVRYVNVLKEKYKVKIILQTFPEHDELFQSVADTFVITQKNEPILPPHDYHISMLSLPYLLDVPIPDPPVFKAKKLDFGDAIKIGICWTGNADNSMDIVRSCPLKFFKPLYDIPGVKLFSFQKDKSKKYYPRINHWEDFADNPDNMDIVDLGSGFNNYCDTANALVSMDLIVSVDTSVALLAGSLGVPTWTLLNVDGEWRWGLHKTTTPWFKSMRLFRQKNINDWEYVINKVKLALIKEIKIGNIQASQKGEYNE